MQESNYESESLPFCVTPLGDDEDEYIAITGESLLNFGVPFWQKYLDRIGRENARSIRLGDQCIGGLAFYRMGHWFGGRPIPCAGISGVAIRPDQRGDGAADALCRSVLHELYDENFPLASLFASTQPLYRRLGFEHAGTRTLYSLPISSILAGHDRSCPVHRVTAPDFSVLDVPHRIRAASSNGQLQRSNALWDRLIHPISGRETTTYLFGDRQSPEGYLVLVANQADQGVGQPLLANDFALTSGRSMQRLLALVRDHRSIYDSFCWWGAPHDQLLLSAGEGRAVVREQTRWMLRILNLPAALAGRGYPSHLSTTLDLAIEDPMIPENSGCWQLVVTDGRGEVQAGGSGRIKMEIRSLAPLYSSYTSASQLATIGRIETSDPGALITADQLFAGPEPWMPEMF